MTGSAHIGPVAGPWFTSQQSCAPVQHWAPQHVPAQFVAVHAGVMHVPSQRILGDEHVVPQPPQLCGSFASFTHWPLQHLRPTVHAGQTPVPEVAAVVVVPDPVTVVVDPLPVAFVAVAFVAVPVPAPPLPFRTVLEQPMTASASTPMVIRWVMSSMFPSARWSLGDFEMPKQERTVRLVSGC